MQTDQLIRPIIVSVTPEITAQQIEICERFIYHYSRIEYLMSRSEALNYLHNRIDKRRVQQIRHAWDYIIRNYQMCNRDFGKLYFSLSDFHRLLIIETWGLHYYATGYSVYRDSIFANSPDKALAPVLIQLLHNMMIFFASHAIYYHTTETIRFDHIPAPGRCDYGTQNWARHLTRYKQLCQRYPADYYNAFTGILSYYPVTIQKSIQ